MAISLFQIGKLTLFFPHISHKELILKNSHTFSTVRSFYGSLDLFPPRVAHMNTNRRISMDTNTHFAKGSDQPIPPNDGQLRLFSMRFCPYAHRAHLVLNAKQLPYHVFYINLSEKPEWYAKVNPNGKVPALNLVSEPNEPFLVESMTICEYLDEKYPDVKLFPSDPLIKAETKLWIERFGSIGGAFYGLVYQKNTEEVNDKLLSDLCDGLNAYEAELLKRGTTYFGGEKPGIFDYGIWPWFERLGTLSLAVGDKFKLDGGDYPTLAKWTSVLQEDPAVQKHFLPLETHKKFSGERPDGIPNYNILVDA